MLATFRTYQWVPGLTAALLFVSGTLPLVMACLHCAVPAEADGMHDMGGMHATKGIHAGAMPCPGMNDASAAPMLAEDCGMEWAGPGCCSMQAPSPAPEPRALMKTSPRLLALVDALVATTAPRLDLPTPVFLPLEAAVPLVSSISLSLLIGSLRN